MTDVRTMTVDGLAVEAHHELYERRSFAIGELARRAQLWDWSDAATRRSRRVSQKDRIASILSGRAMTVAEISRETDICVGSVGAVLYGNQHIFKWSKVPGVSKRVWKTRDEYPAAREAVEAALEDGR